MSQLFVVEQAPQRGYHAVFENVTIESKGAQ